MNSTKRKTITIATDELVSVGGEPFKILDTTSFPNRVFAMNLNSGSKTIVEISDIQVLDTENLVEIDLATIEDKDWREARLKFKAIEPLLEHGGSEAVVAQAIEESGYSRSALFKFRSNYLKYGSIEGLLPRKRGTKKGTRFISPAVDRIISSVIEDLFLKRPPCPQQEVVDEVERLCGNADLPIPSAGTVRKRIDQIPRRIRMHKRYGRKAAQRIFQPSRGHFPEADFPGQSVQIDHTPADLIIVDDKHRKPIGRPWVTLAIDVFSRAIYGYHTSLEAPSALSNAMVMTQSVLSKDKWLEKLNIDADWPVWGIMKSVHIDNGPDFHSNAFKGGCDRYNIKLEYRPKGFTHFGGHIERKLGSMSDRSHSLPGSTGHSITDKGDYDAEGNACMTMAEFERWLVSYICKVYHMRDHSETGEAPIKRWKSGFTTTPDLPPVHLELPRCSETFMIDFLPMKKRTIQRYGVQWDLNYYNEALRPWIGTLDETDKKKKAKLIVRRDPRDISKVWVYEPILKTYILAHCSDQTIGPISLWEYKEAKKQRKSRGNTSEERRQILNTAHQMREEVNEAARKTKSARRKQQRQINNSNIVDPTNPMRQKPTTKSKTESDAVFFEFEDKEFELGDDVSW